MPENEKDQVQPVDHNTKDTQENKTADNSHEEDNTVTKQIEKMRKRIDAEAGRKNEYRAQLEKSQNQVKTLTEQLKQLQGAKKSQSEDDKPDELKKVASENEELKAQLVRRDQMDTVASQFSQAGVTVPKGVLQLAVPAGISEEQVSKNVKALSTWYDSIVSSTRDEFLKGRTPRVGGPDNKPFDRSELRKISDPSKRIALIKQHLKDFE